jgi:hypothetical protein
MAAMAAMAAMELLNTKKKYLLEIMNHDESQYLGVKN